MRNTSTKITTSFFLLVLMLVGCNPPADLSGKIEGAEMQDTKVYLIEPVTLRDVGASYFGKVIDSAAINSDGSFEFNNLPNTPEPMLLELAIQQPGKAPQYLQTDEPNKANYMPIVWKFGEPIQITAKRDEFQKSFSMKNPSETNKAMLELRDIHQKAYQTHLEGKHWEVEDGDQLMDKAHSLLEFQEELIDFANRTEYLLPALVALRWLSPVSDYERVPEFLVNQCAKWSGSQPNHPWVAQLCVQSQPANLPVLVGDVFPNLTFPMLTKDTLALHEQLGEKLTIIDLWASWCAPCRKENKEVLVPLWDDYHTQGLQIVAYALEGNEASWRAAAEQDGADRWLQVSDLQGDEAEFLKIIRVRTIPANFILDEKGVVIAKNVHAKELLDFVSEYMKKD